MSSEFSAPAKPRRGPTLRSRQVSPTARRHTTPQSLRDLAYEAIKFRIITCAFKPGEYINEAQVCSVLGLGRTPVHQALDRLMLEGMVQFIPRKGVIVKPVSLDEVMQIIEARFIVEPQGVRLAAARADENDIAGLADILNRAQQWTAVRNVQQMMLLDREFHQVLVRATRNDVFADILNKLHERSLRFWFISLTDIGHHGVVQEEHQAILQAIRDRDLDAAEQAMRRHIESFRTNVTRQL
jgi:DNA-binding GntR family transcriptional regulator